MTSPLMRAVGDRRSGRRALAMAFAFLLFAGAGLSVRAADDDPYSVTVKVDASSDVIGKARDAARLDGQRRALTTLADRRSGGNGAAKLPKLDDKAITDMIASFEVANERMSAVRYVADVTFHFRPDEVDRVLQKGGIGVAGEASASSGKPLVVIPVYQSGATAVLWDDPNPWREAWAQRPQTTSGGTSAGTDAVQFAVPLGDAGDIAVIDAAKARAGNAAALAKIAQQNDGEEAIVVLATPRGAADNKPGGLDVTVRRYRAGQPVDVHADSVTANPGEGRDAFYRRAVAAIAADIEAGWKKGPVPGYDQQGSLTAIMPITGLDDWIRVRERLAGLPAIRKLALVALSLQEATIEIEYVGSVDQLKTSLAETNLDLVRGDPTGQQTWRLARSGAPAGR
jgi:hypothetical protein